MDHNHSRKDPVLEKKDPPVRVPKRKEILALAESMNHSRGQAIGTVEDMIFEMNSALQDMIFRWDFCGEAYERPIQSRAGKRLVRELAEAGIEYLKEVKHGALWKDQSNSLGKGEENEHKRMCI